MDRLTIFFDLDDTLYDRSIPYERAFSQFFGGRYAEKLLQAFDAVIHRGYEVFTDAHTGKISMEAMHIYRHQTGLADAGISITPDEALRFQALYAEQQRHITLSDTMRRVLDLCRERFAAVGVITNGSVGSQTGKLKSLGMERWVPAQLVFISDAVGVMKPAPEIFRMAQKAAGGGPCLFVGDSWTQDGQRVHGAVLRQNRAAVFKGQNVIRPCQQLPILPKRLQRPLPCGGVAEAGLYVCVQRLLEF